MRRRAVCLANLKSLATSSLVYAEANQGILPAAAHDPLERGLAAQSATVIGDRPAFPDRQTADGGLRNNGSNLRGWHKLLQGGMRAYMQPKQFICPQAREAVDHTNEGTATEAFVVDPASWSWANGDDPDGTLTQLYDFDPTQTSVRGSQLATLSYSMHVTLRSRGEDGAFHGGALTNTQDPRLAFAADRNPYSNKVVVIDSTTGTVRYDFDPTRRDAPPADHPGRVFSKELTTPPDDPSTSANLWRDANSLNHDGKGQNVTYLDGSAKWSNHPWAGGDDDFLWSPQDPNASMNTSTGILTPLQPESGIRYGHMRPKRNTETDSFLIP